MIEYNDGRFGSISPAKDILEMLHTTQKFEDIKAVHMGTVKELMDIRLGRHETNSILQELDEIKKQLEVLQPKGPIKIYDLEDIPK